MESHLGYLLKPCANKMITNINVERDHWDARYNQPGDGAQRATAHFPLVTFLNFQKKAKVLDIIQEVNTTAKGCETSVKSIGFTEDFIKGQVTQRDTEKVRSTTILKIKNF